MIRNAWHFQCQPLGFVFMVVWFSFMLALLTP
nr:DUF3265 domain-containing protein [Enterovibrio norvegicus]